VSPFAQATSQAFPLAVVLVASPGMTKFGMRHFHVPSPPADDRAGGGKRAGAPALSPNRTPAHGSSGSARLGAMKSSAWSVTVGAEQAA